MSASLIVNYKDKSKFQNPASYLVDRSFEYGLLFMPLCQKLTFKVDFSLVQLELNGFGNFENKQHCSI